MQQQKPPHRDDTPLSKRFLMALVGILILLASLYVLSGNKFPTEITYKKVGGSGTPYVIQRESPKRL